GFAGGFEALGEGSDDGIAADRGEGGHVEDAANGSSSGVDGSFAFEAAAVVVERGHADQGADGASVQLSQLAEAGQQGGAEDRAGAGHGADDAVFAVQVVVGFDELSDLL